jgi:hypothetical protein
MAPGFRITAQAGRISSFGQSLDAFTVLQHGSVCIACVGRFDKFSHYHKPNVTVHLYMQSQPDLVAAITPRRVLGSSLSLLQQSIQQSRDKGSLDSGEDGVRALESDKPVRSELVGGGQHAYRISLKADQFLKLIVEQQGIDVVAQVTGSDGKQILEFDSESGPWGREEVSLVAEEAGSFMLTVRAKHNRTAAGNYEIRIEELRVATDTDRALRHARKHFDEAMKLESAGKYDEALKLSKSAEEYSIHSASLDGDEFGIVGALAHD